MAAPAFYEFTLPISSPFRTVTINTNAIAYVEPIPEPTTGCTIFLTNGVSFETTIPYATVRTLLTT